MTDINQSAYESGMKEFEKLQGWAAEAVEHARKAREEAAYYKSQNDLLTQQHEADQSRHRADMRRIAELEAFIAAIIEQYRSAEEKLQLGHFRRANSVAKISAADAGRAAVEDELRKLSPLVAQKN